MPKVQSRFINSSGIKDRNVRHLSCEGCRKRKMKCSRTMPCAGCEVRGTECIWLDCKPTFGMLEPSLEETQAEITRLRKVITQLQAIVIERDGRPLPLPTTGAPPTPPYNLDALPTITEEYYGRADDSHLGIGSSRGGAAWASNGASDGASFSSSAPSWVPFSWLAQGSSSSSSSSVSHPSWAPSLRDAFPSPEMLPWAGTGPVEQLRPRYDSIVSYADLLAEDMHPDSRGGPASSTPGLHIDDLPSSSSAAHARAATWPSPRETAREASGSLSVTGPSSSLTGLTGPSRRAFHLAPVWADSTAPARIPGHETVSAVLDGVRIQASPAAAEALGLSLVSTGGHREPDDGLVPDNGCDESDQAQAVEWERWMAASADQLQP